MTLDYYFGRQLLKSSLLVLAAFLGIVVFMDFVHELSKISDEYTIETALHETLYSVATHLYELLPAVVMTGALLSFGTLAQQSELLAAQATGYSRTRIIISAVITGIIFIIILFVIGDLLVPKSENARLASRMEQSGFQKTEFDIWARDGQNFIHALRMDKNNIYRDISIYEYDKEGNLMFIMQADSMKVEKRQIHLNQVKVTELTGNDIHTSFESHRIIMRTTGIESEILQAISPQRLSFLQLSDYINFLKKSKLRADLHELALWKRVVQPFSVIVMLLIAMPFVFSPIRSPSAGKRLFLGIMVGLSYIIIDNGFSSWVIISGWPVEAGVLALPLLCLAGSGVVLLRYRR